MAADRNVTVSSQMIPIQLNTTAECVGVAAGAGHGGGRQRTRSFIDRALKAGRSILCGGLVASSLLVSIKTADAQQHRVASVRVLVDEWNYVAVYDEAGGTIPAGTAVSAARVIAFRDQSKVVGDNLSIVMYTLGEDSTWTRDTFTTQDQWKIVRTLKEELSIPDTDDHRWGVAINEESNSQVATSVLMSTGVVEGDPLALVLLNAPDPAELTQLLVCVGYAAAKTPTDFPADESDPIEKIDLLAYTIMIEGTKLEASTLIVATEIYSIGFGGSLVAVIVPISDRPMGPPTPWTPPVCTVSQGLFLCTFEITCEITRTQRFISKRTQSCVIAGVNTYCDQQTILICTETHKCKGASVPGVIIIGTCVQSRWLPPPNSCYTMWPSCADCS